MSPATRRGHHTRNRITSPLLNNVTNDIGFEETKEAFCSLAISECEPQHLDELWQELRRSYEVEDARNSQPFPSWALKNLPIEQMKAMIRVTYYKDLGAIDHYAASISSHFDVEPWKFILFFNYIEQGRARILSKVSITRPALTFEQLYEEVRRNRLNRLNRLTARKIFNMRQKNPRADFQPSDYRGCLQGSDDGDGSDEEIEDESMIKIDIETGDDGNDNIGQEPYFRLIDEDISMSHQESNDNGGCDAENSHGQGGHHADNLDGMNTEHGEHMIARDDLDDRSASSPQTTQKTRPDFIVPPPTDSGYRSASAMEGSFSMSAQRVSTTKMTQKLSEWDLNDTATEYSDESMTTLSKKPDYIWELAGELSKNVSSLIIDEMTRTRISDILPELLKVFAFKVGYDGQTQMHRDIMTFVHKHRRDIGAAFTDITFKQGGDDSNRSKSSMDGMSLEDRIRLWLKETSFEEPPEEFLRSTAGNGEPTEEIFPAGAEHENEKVSEGQFPAYREFFIASNAYEWLLARLRRECHLVSTEPNALAVIRESITNSLPSSRKISRRVSPQSSRATFELDWDILDFFNTQGYLKQPSEVFEGVITITGSCWDAQATTCAQYIKQMWPLIGEVVIQLIKKVLEGTKGYEYGCKISEGTTITAWIDSQKFKVGAYGDSISIAETGELFAWLGAALRTSPRQNGLMYCVPNICHIVHNTSSLQNIDLQPSSTHVTYEIEFLMEEIPEPLITANGQCWHNIFRNPVIVKGYPIPQRTEWNTGLEISLNIMAGLAQTRRLDQFKDKVYIKGFSTILVPTKKNKDFLCWHLIYNKGGDRISYLDDYMDQEQYIKQLDLENCRHVLGWCSEEKLYAGSPEAYHPVLHSRLPKPQADGALAGVSVSGGKMILSGPVFDKGAKDIPVYVSRKGYIRQLKWISTKFILLWDERDKRGWLINGTSALLHIVRAFLSHAKDDSFQSAFCFKSEDLREAENPHTADSAIAVLLNSHNRGLKLYEDEDEDEYLLKTQIGHFYSILEKLIDHQADVAGHCGANLSDKPRKYLEGWDFEDLATDCPILHPRVATIAAAGKGWVDFIRSIHAVTLFGRGFGDIIQPAASNQCSYWTKVPTKQYYITSCASDLDRLMKEAGSHHDVYALLCDNLIYHTPTPVYRPCQCGDTPGQKHCEPVRTLVPLSMCKSLPSRTYSIQPRGSGAVIIGYNSHFPLIWGDSGPPQQNELLETEPLSKSIKEDTDSGVGSNILESELESYFIFQSNSGNEHSSMSPSDLHPQTAKNPMRNGIVPINSKTYTKNQYTVGIICPLAKEFKAVRALFDNVHGSLITILEDDNCYALGDMAGHWVVATCLPAGEYGTNSAASVASNLKRSFPRIRFCLLVGIGGGAPSEEKDIRLGDVVVGLPAGTSPGVLQYDLGKEENGNHFRLLGSLQRPPRILTTAINALQSDPEPSVSQLDESLRKIADRLPEYKYPGQDLDILSHAACASCPSHQASPRSCSHKRQRGPRTTAIPTIHYGLIASGNRVVKDVTFRNQLTQEHDIMCFEMEAAGVINAVNSLVIRGICDYCDPQKNDIWQEYAAATAAAYAKLLLGVVPKVGHSGADSMN